MKLLNKLLSYGVLLSSSDVLFETNSNSNSFIDIREIYKKLQISIVNDDLSKITYNYKVPLVYLDNKLGEFGNRFILAHMLYHILTTPGFVISCPNVKFVAYEKLANKFAYELLMPSYLVKYHILNVGKDFNKLSELLQVDIGRVKIRLLDIL